MYLSLPEEHEAVPAHCEPTVKYEFRARPIKHRLLPSHINVDARTHNKYDPEYLKVRYRHAHVSHDLHFFSLLTSLHDHTFLFYSVVLFHTTIQVKGRPITNNHREHQKSD